MSNINLPTTQETRTVLYNQANQVNRLEPDYQRIEHLTAQGKIKDAWKNYVSLTHWESGGYEYTTGSGESFTHANRHLATSLLRRNYYVCLNSTWGRLPPEALISAVVDDETIPETMRSNAACRDLNIERTLIPLELIRDCACAYEGFAKKCLKEASLWHKFSNYPEYIVDIAEQNSFFALKVVTTPKGAIITKDEYRMQIFEAAYKRVLNQINSGMMTDQELNSLGSFLLQYKSIISQEAFAKVKTLASAAKTNLSSSQANFLDVVVRKLSLQRVYQEGIGFINVVTDENDLLQKVQDLNLGHDGSKGFMYLSLMPKTAEGFVSSRLLLGHNALDLKDTVEAGKYFLEAAFHKKAEEHKEEALLLGAASLFMKTYNEEKETWEFTARKEEKLNDTFVDLLSPEDVRTLTKNIQEFCSLIRKEYPNETGLLSLIKHIPDPKAEEISTGGLD